MNNKLQEAIDRLADKIEYGHLIAGISSVDFLNAASHTIEKPKSGIAQSLNKLRELHELIDTEGVCPEYSDFVLEIEEILEKLDNDTE